MIRLCSMNDLSKYQRSRKDINFAIVRNMQERLPNVQQFDRLAPSKELYSFLLKNKDKEGFYDIYHKAFQEELISNEKQIGLSLVEDLVNQGFEVNLVCYCKDASFCHRQDVYEALKLRGIECELY